MSLSGQEKAAIFLMSLGEEVAAEVMKVLSAEDVRTLLNNMKRLKRISPDQMEKVLKEASELISLGRLPLSGDEFTRAVLSKGLLEDVVSDNLGEDDLEMLKDVDVRSLVQLLKEEHPQVIALLLALMEPAKAAEVLEQLPEQLRADVTLRIATLERIPENAVELLRDILKDRIEIVKTQGVSFSGIRTVAEIMNKSRKEIEEGVLEKIEMEDPELAETIKENMLVFEDLINLDDRAIQAILKEVTTEELSIALKTASEAMKKKIFNNMSQRAAQMLKDEMETRGPVRVSDVEKAQQNIVKIARKLEEEGKIVIGKGESLV